MANRWRLRPRFSLWAMLVLVTVVAIPLSYVAQRRSFNLRRLAAYERLNAKFASLKTVVSEVKEPTAPTWWQLTVGEAAPLHIDHVSVFSKWSGTTGPSPFEITDRDLEELALFPEIEEFNASGGLAITDKGLSAIAQLPNLRRLELLGLPLVTGEFLNHFPPKNGLDQLTLAGLSELEGANLQGLKGLSSLTSLTLSELPRLADESLQGVDLPMTVSRLTVNCRIGEGAVTRWLKNTQLEELHFRAIPRNAAHALGSQIELRNLFICDSSIEDEDLLSLKRLTKLDSLTLSIVPIRGRFLAELGDLPQLRNVRLDNSLIEDQHLFHLEKLKALESVDLSWTPLTGEGFAKFTKAFRPRDVRLLGTQFSEKGKTALAACEGVEFADKLDLPSNWTADDLDFFPHGSPKEDFRLPIAAAVEAKKERQEEFRYYLHEDEDWWFTAVRENWSHNELATVVQLHELAKSKKADEERLESEYERIKLPTEGSRSKLESDPFE